MATIMTKDQINTLINKLNTELNRRYNINTKRTAAQDLGTEPLVGDNTKVSHTLMQSIESKRRGLTSYHNKKDRTGLVKCTEGSGIPSSGWNGSNVSGRYDQNDLVGSYVDNYNLLLNDLTALNQMTPCVEATKRNPSRYCGCDPSYDCNYCGCNQTCSYSSGKPCLARHDCTCNKGVENPCGCHVVGSGCSCHSQGQPCRTNCNAHKSCGCDCNQYKPCRSVGCDDCRDWGCKCDTDDSCRPDCPNYCTCHTTSCSCDKVCSEFSE